MFIILYIKLKWKIYYIMVNDHWKTNSCQKMKQTVGKLMGHRKKPNPRENARVAAVSLRN